MCKLSPFTKEGLVATSRSNLVMCFFMRSLLPLQGRDRICCWCSIGKWQKRHAVPDLQPWLDLAKAQGRHVPRACLREPSDGMHSLRSLGPCSSVERAVNVSLLTSWFFMLAVCPGVREAPVAALLKSDFQASATCAASSSSPSAEPIAMMSQRLTSCSASAVVLPPPGPSSMGGGADCARTRRTPAPLPTDVSPVELKCKKLFLNVTFIPGIRNLVLVGGGGLPCRLEIKSNWQASFQRSRCESALPQSANRRGGQKQKLSSGGRSRHVA
mmetsp:Transcript_101258/g.292827  ORF Transcript_101258/g.292827 Transcript_101258/m.292827 type:complete len:271 (+) Transcript_101258:164-976(+)